MSRLCSAILPRKYCIHPIDPSKTTIRCLSTSLPKTSEEQVPRQSSHSPRTQNTTEELARYFDDGDLSQRDDIRRLDNSLPNRPFRRSRQPSTQGQTYGQTQSDQRRRSKPDGYSFRKLDLGAPPESEAEVQTTPRPLFRYDNNRQPPSTNSLDSPTRPQPPPRAGALDLRNLSAQPAPSRPQSQRLPLRQTNPNRSRGAGSDARRPNGTEAARKAPSSTPRSRPRQSRTNASPQRPQIYDSKDADTGLSEEELEYMREKEEAKTPKPQAYVPAAVSLESLGGLGAGLPAFGVGAWGQEEAVADWAEGWERRRLRKRIRSGVWLDGVERFRGAAGVEAEMGDEGRKGESGEKENMDEGNGESGEVLRREFDGRKVAERMFRGEYVFDGKQEEGVLGSLRRQAVRNGTYFPEDGQSLAEKVRSLLPAAKTGGGGARV